MITFRKLGKLGRFGAQLFQYAGVRLYAEKNGFDFALPDWAGTKIFQRVKPWTKIEKIKAFFYPKVQLNDMKSYNKIDKILWLIYLKKNPLETQSLESLYKNPRDNISLYGYILDEFSFQLLKENREKIKSWFQFKKELEEKCQKVTAGLNPWIGIHIRKGDFVKRGINLPVSQYKSKLEEIKNQFPGHRIFIATDDKTIIPEFSDYNLIKLSSPLTDVPEYVFDFWMLAHSKIIIGGGSVFSWWAAFLSDQNYYYAPPLTVFWSEDYIPEITEQTLNTH